MHHPNFPSIPRADLENTTGGAGGGGFNWTVIAHNKSQAKAKDDALTASILSPKSPGGAGGKAGKVDASAGLGGGGG